MSAEERWTARLFRRALKLFPEWFSREYEDEMVTVFLEESDEIRRARGRFARAAFVMRSFLELPAAVWRIRRDERAKRGAYRGSLRGAGWLDDVVHAGRSLRRAPTWTGAALAILILGIGGTTAVFSVLHAVLLRPLPLGEPDRLVSMWTVNRQQSLPDGSSWLNARDWLERGTSLEDVALVFRPEFTASTVTSFGEPERIHVGWVSANFFDLLGVTSVAGRFFGEADEEADTRLVVVGEPLWNARWGADPDAIGSSMTIGGEEYLVVGVAPRDLSIPLRETQVWRLQDVRSPEASRGFDGYWTIGRLRPGVTIAEARRDLDRVSEELSVLYPETNRNRGVSADPLRAEIVGESLPLLLWSVFTAMLLVLLIGGANVAQLMLGRGVLRRREIAVRVSLGASRGRINRQLLLEGVLLSAAACAGGLAVAMIGLDALVSLAPSDVPLIETVRMNRAVLLAAIGFSAIVAPLIGLLPALVSSRGNAAEALRSGGRGSTPSDRRSRSVLVVAEVTMAVILLAGAGLLLRSAHALQSVEPGFDARRALIARIDLSPAEPGSTRVARHAELLGRLEGHPGVRSASTISQFFVERIPDQTITLVGTEPPAVGEPSVRLTTDHVYPGFFAALGVPLLRGRSLEARDVGVLGQPDVVVVNEAWVDAFSPERDPVGRQFRWGRQVEGSAITVIGVVGDLRRNALEERAYPQMFAAGGGTGLDVVVMTEGDPTDAAPAVRAAVRDIDAGAAVSRVGPVWDRYDVGMAPRNFQTFMLGAFAALATLLAAVGLFAVLHDAVAARRREIGIRVALGAGRGGVRRMVLGQALGLSVIGLTLGMGTVIALSSVTSRFVYGIAATDPLTLGTAALLLLGVTALACFVPVRQATHVSPIEALREE